MFLQLTISSYFLPKICRKWQQILKSVVLCLNYKKKLNFLKTFYKINDSLIEISAPLEQENKKSITCQDSTMNIACDPVFLIDVITQIMVEFEYQTK